jgi:hypothetical protein
MVPDSVRTCCATAVLTSIVTATNMRGKLDRFRTGAFLLTLQIAEDTDCSFEFSAWPEAIVRNPPRRQCVLPGVLVLCNIAQSTENRMSRSDSYPVSSRLHPQRPSDRRSGRQGCALIVGSLPRTTSVGFGATVDSKDFFELATLIERSL